MNPGRFNDRDFFFLNRVEFLRQILQLYFAQAGMHLPLIHNWCRFYTKTECVARQSISFTEPNDEWLKAQLDKKEYASKSELVNDLIRQARKQQVEIDWVRVKLEKAENSGFTGDSKTQTLNQSKSLLNG